MNNLKEIKTTGMGILLLIAAALDLWIFEKLEALYVAAIGVVGILFLFAPDKIINILLRKAKK
jgi:hypothetical protein